MHSGPPETFPEPVGAEAHPARRIAATTECAGLLIGKRSFPPYLASHELNRTFISSWLSTHHAQS